MNKIKLNKLEHIWSILCTNTSVDQATQNMTLFNVLEQINLNRNQFLSQKPKDGKAININFPFRLVSFFRIESGKFSGKLKTEIFDPADQSILQGETPVEMNQPGKERLRIINEFPGMPITKEGYYTFVVYIKSQEGDYEEVGKIPLQLKLTD